MGSLTRGARATCATCAVGLLLAVAACGPSIHVETDYSKQANFGAFKTYGYADVPTAAAPQNGLDPLLTEKVREALDHYLPTKGLQKADASQADVIVYAWGSTKEKIEVNNWGYTYGGYRYGGYYAPNTTVSNYDEGTLVVDLVDPRNKQLVWRGTASATVNDRSDKIKKIPEAVADMISRYPPKS